MLLNISISYNSSAVLKELDRAALEEVFAHLPGADIEHPDKLNSWTTYIVDAQVAFPIFAKHGIVCEVKPVQEDCMLVKLQDRIRHLELHYEDEVGMVNNNAAQVIAIPDIGLMTVREVTYLEDACTDDLQDHLDKGWRLLAVCPPNAARRPDYILGRSTVAES